MTHDELLAKIDKLKANASGDVWLIHNDRCWVDCTCDKEEQEVISPHKALRAVVELHKKDESGQCVECSHDFIYEYYPCPTIQAIKKELL